MLLDVPATGNVFYFEWEMNFLLALQNLHNPVLDAILSFLSILGNAGILWIAIALILLIPKKTRWTGFEMGCAMLLTYIIGNLILKNTVARMRPCWINDTVELLVRTPSDYSFPSGHTMNGFTGALCIFYHDKRWGAAALVLASVIAFSRMYLFVHFPTDILVGIVIGALSSILMYFIFKKWRAYLAKKSEEKAAK